MQRAFIFDLDGVLIDDEQNWEDAKEDLYKRLFGEEVAKKLDSTLGMNTDGIYDMAVASGANVNKEELVAEFFKVAENIYSTCPLTDDLDRLVEELIKLDYRIGLVSSSPLVWVNEAYERLPFKDHIELVISLYERPDLKPKPAPDGYLEAIQSLGAVPATAIILEDSNMGIRSAKDSGALTVGFKQNLPKDYTQSGADVYADSIADVMAIVMSRA